MGGEAEDIDSAVSIIKDNVCVSAPAQVDPCPRVRFH